MQQQILKRNTNLSSDQLLLSEAATALKGR